MVTTVTALPINPPTIVRHDPLTMALHWITAFLVLSQFASAHIWENLEKGTAARLDLIYLHLAFGILLTVTVALRVVWRIVRRHRMPPATTGLQRLAAEVVHLCLYVLLVAQVALGLAFSWSSGKPLPFFNFFEIPPLMTIDPAYRHQIAELHNTVAWIIIAVVALHAAAALMHHYVLGDKVLQRMLPANRRRG